MSSGIHKLLSADGKRPRPRRPKWPAKPLPPSCRGLFACPYLFWLTLLVLSRTVQLWPKQNPSIGLFPARPGALYGLLSVFRSKTTVNPDRIFERELLNRRAQRPHCPTGSKRGLRGLSSLCRRSPPLMPVIGIVIVKPPLSERLAGSHLGRGFEMHKHSLPPAILLCCSWTRKGSACHPGRVVFLSANHKIRAVRVEDSDEEPKIHGSFWAVAAPIGY